MSLIEWSIDGFDSEPSQFNCIKEFWEQEELLEHTLVYVEFVKSRSKRYSDIVEIAKKLPNYKADDNSHSFVINTVEEYVRNTVFIEYTISIVGKWKNTTVILNGKQFTGKTSMWHFKKVLKENTREYYNDINPNIFYDFIPEEPIEDLPFPYVLYPGMYGSFFAFKENKEAEDIYFCECEREAINNYITLQKRRYNINKNNGEPMFLSKNEFPDIIEQILSSNSENLLSMFKFKSGICHKCNGKLPQQEYCSSMYGTSFTRQYGWFINQRYFEYGIDYMLEGSISLQKELILRDKCPIDILKIWDEFILASEKSEDNPNSDELYKLAKEARRNFEKCIENTVRKEFGFKNVGEAWVSETTLANIIRVIYPNCKIKWLIISKKP